MEQQSENNNYNTLTYISLQIKEFALCALHNVQISALKWPIVYVCSYEHLVSGKLHLAFENVMRPGIALPMVSAQKVFTYNKRSFLRHVC